jgi:hypothetical protein
MAGLVCIGAVGGCTVDVDLGFPTGNCEGGGPTLLNGASEVSADGCERCACNEGKVECIPVACDPCPDEDRPTCADTPVSTLGCAVEAQCGEAGWECIDTCACSMEDEPDCPPPFPGCYYQGPFCDGQQWNCGPPVCPTCEPDFVCEKPADPLCYVDQICNDLLSWECIEVCPPCGGPAPKCDEFSVATCDAEGWICQGTATCGPELIECPASKLPFCELYTICGQAGWACQESCEVAYCPDEEPKCEQLGPSNCLSAPLCTSQGWQCAESCM